MFDYIVAGLAPRIFAGVVILLLIGIAIGSLIGWWSAIQWM